mgnify:CR=1 FL=1
MNLNELYTQVITENSRSKENRHPVEGATHSLEGVNPSCGDDITLQLRVMDGKIFVGRADDMDIQILGDNKIARRNHAVIVFDAKKRENMILPGDSNGLVYLNGEAVYLPQPLSAYDVIEMGESTFLFVPFCGEHYMWEDDK